MATEPVTYFEMPELKSANHAGKAAQVACSTRKYCNSQILSAVTVQWVGDGFASFLLYEDFRKVILKSNGRATEKVLRQQHAAAFNADYLPLLKAEIVAFYYEQATKDAEDAA